MSTTIQSLCLTCSASLPPRKKTQDAPQGECFITKCCSRAICPACILANPRLSRYHPCLACLAGVSAVASSSGLNSKHTFRGTSASGRPSGNPRGLLSSHGTEPKTWVQIETASSDDAVLSFANVDGSLRDGDLFIVGDDEDDETSSERVSNSGSPPPPYPEFPLPSPPLSRATATVIRPLSDHNEDNIVTQHVIGGPVHDTITIDKSDTLLGIALRYGVDVRALSTGSIFLSFTPIIISHIDFLTFFQPCISLSFAALPIISSRLQILFIVFDLTFTLSSPIHMLMSVRIVPYAISLILTL